MRYKKIIMLTIILTCLLAVSTVNATDNATNDVVGMEEKTDDVISVDDVNDSMGIENHNQVILSVDNESNYLSDDMEGTFTELANKIDNTNGKLILTKNYVYSRYGSDDRNGINIRKKITIDGNGFTIDGKNDAGNFKIYNDEVIFENLNFIGSSLGWYGNNGVVNNCTFINSTSKDFASERSIAEGGAIYWEGENGTVKNCNFINSTSISICGGFNDPLMYGDIATAEARAGAILWTGSNGILCNCSFVNSSTNSICIDEHEYGTFDLTSLGGSIYWIGSNGNINNCNFENSKSISMVYLFGYSYYDDVFGGDAIYLEGSNVTITNCNFVNCSCQGNGTIYCSGNSEKVVNSNFFNCSSDYGGAIYWKGETGCVNDCSFLNCYSVYYGDCIYWEGNSGIISNSSFFSNHNLAQETYVYWIGLYGAIENSNVDSLSKLYYSKYKIKLLNNKVAKVPTLIVMPTSVTMDYNTKKVITIFLGDMHNNPLVGAEISININGKNSYIKTNNQGQIDLLISNLAPKSYTGVITFEGDNLYLESSKNLQIVVKKATPNITAKAKTFKESDKTKKYTVTLTNNKKIINGATVKITVNKKTYTAKTNKKGVATFKLTKLIKEGAYKATISFAGKGNYAKVSTKVVLTVSKAIPKLTANDKTFKFSDKTKKYTVTLKTDKNKVMKNTKVTLKVNGKTYVAKTNSKGVATFKLTKLTKEGAYKATVKFAGDKNYKSISKNVKITVKNPSTTVNNSSDSKSVILDVIYSDDIFPNVELSNNDVISTTYEQYSGRQWSPGVYARVSYGLGLLEAKHTKLVKCEVWFKDDNGNVITKSSSNFNNYYIKVDLESGFTPYKAEIWYETM